MTALYRREELKNKSNKFKMNYVIDFTGFYDENRRYHLKEYCIVPVSYSKIHEHESHVVKPPSSYEGADWLYRQIHYKGFSDKYGIDWDTGDITEEEARRSIAEILKSAEKIYLSRQRKLDLILKFAEIDTINYELLKDYDIQLNKKVGSSGCQFHVSKQNNCVVSNALEYADWVFINLLTPESDQAEVYDLQSKYEPGTSGMSLLEVDNLDLESQYKEEDFKEFVFDFTGYTYAKEKYTLKEYCIVPMAYNIIGEREFHIVQPPCLFSRLSSFYKNAYLESFNEHGINWNEGDIPEEVALETIKEKLKSATIIYLGNVRQLGLFLKLMGLNMVGKVVVLSEFNYKLTVTSSSACDYHVDLPNKTCVVNNAVASANWLSNILSPIIYEFITESDNVDYQRLIKTITDLRNKSSELESSYNSDDVLELQSNDLDDPKFAENLNSDRVGDFDNDSDNSDSMSLAQQQRLMKSDRRISENPRLYYETLRKRGVIKIRKLNSNKLRQKFDSSVNNLDQDEKLVCKKAVVKLEKLNDNVFRKQYKFGKRIYASEYEK